MEGWVEQKHRLSRRGSSVTMLVLHALSCGRFMTHHCIDCHALNIPLELSSKIWVGRDRIWTCFPTAGLEPAIPNRSWYVAITSRGALPVSYAAVNSPGLIFGLRSRILLHGHCGYKKSGLKDLENFCFCARPLHSKLPLLQPIWQRSYGRRCFQLKRG